jgi:hypothetical protein
MELFCMPQNTATGSKSRSRRRNGSWFERKIRRIRDSRQAQKQLQQFIVIVVAVLIAFFLGYYFFGPSFSSSGE